MYVIGSLIYAKKRGNGSPLARIYGHFLRRGTYRKYPIVLFSFEWATKSGGSLLAARGEILLTSMDADGTKDWGYDLELTAEPV